MPNDAPVYGAYKKTQSMDYTEEFVCTRCRGLFVFESENDWPVMDYDFCPRCGADFRKAHAAYQASVARKERRRQACSRGTHQGHCWAVGRCYRPDSPNTYWCYRPLLHRRRYNSPTYTPMSAKEALGSYKAECCSANADKRGVIALVFLSSPNAKPAVAKEFRFPEPV